MSAARSRSLPLGLLGLLLALGMGGRQSLALDVIGSMHHPSKIYVSNARGVNGDHGTFVLHLGDGGEATYSMSGGLFRRQLRDMGVYASSTCPWVNFHIFREVETLPGQPPRMWAFQSDDPSLNGYVIYLKIDGGEPWDAQGWKIYDFASRHHG